MSFDAVNSSRSYAYHWVLSFMKLWVPHTTLSMNILTKDWKHRESGVKELLGVSVYSTTSYTCTKYNDVTRIYLSHLISRHASSLHQQGQTRHRNENTKKKWKHLYMLYIRNPSAPWPRCKQNSSAGNSNIALWFEFGVSGNWGLAVCMYVCACWLNI